MLLGVLSAPAQQEQPPSIKVDVDVVNLLCSVRDKRGGLVANLTKDDFDVFEDGKRFVEVPEGKDELKNRKVEVQTGLSDGLNIEILCGLKEGEKVVEKPPREIK